MSRDVMQQAFDALRTCSWSRETEDAITALSEELAKPEQEPVAWISKHGVVYPLDAKDEVHPINELQPLYAAPQAAPCQSIHDYTSEADTEELVRVSNLPEPLHLAFLLEKTMQWPLHGKAADCLRRMHTAQRQPLTDAMVQESKMLDDYNERGIFIDGWLKAEAAHNIKEKE